MTLARASLALLIAALSITAMVAVRTGVPIDTALADLAPPSVSLDGRANASVELGEQVRRYASRTVRFALVAPSADATGSAVLAGAHEDLLQRLDVLEGIQRIKESDRLDGLIQALEPHRFSLLAPSLARDVDEGAFDSVAEDAIAALYGPGVEARPLPLEADPLNSLGGWLESMLHASVGDMANNAASVELMPFIVVDLLRVESAMVDDEQLVTRLEQVRMDVLDAWPGLTLHRTGVLFFSHEAAQASRVDIDRISIGSVLGLLLLLLPVFRSFWPLVLPALSIVIGAATGAALVWIVFGSMHVLTLVFGASLIGIVIDYSVHGFAHSLSSDATASSSARRLDPRLRRALLLSLLTSSLGYAALGFSSVDALARVALFSVGGLFGAWLCVIALLPLMVGPRSVLHTALLAWPVALLTRVGKWLARPVLARPKGTLAAAALVLVLLMMFARSDDDPRRLIDLSPELLADASAIAGLGDDVDVARRLLVTAPDLQGAYSALAAIQSALPTDIRMTSLANWLPGPAEQQRNRGRSGQLLADDGPAAMLFDAIGEPDTLATLENLRGVLERDVAAPLQSGDALDTLLADPALGLPPLLVRQQGSVATIGLLTRDADPQVLADAVMNVNLQLDDGVRVTLQDSVADTARALGTHRRSGLALLCVALLAIATLLLVVYRRVAVLGLVAVPAASILLTVLLLTMMGVSLTLFHSVGLFLVLGLGMDYTIFLAELERHASRTTLAAILLSGATSLLSFGLLATSSIPVARFFGQTVLIGNGFNLVLTFVLLAILTRSNAPAQLPGPESRVGAEA